MLMLDNNVDKSFKADAQVYASGATGLLQKELSQGKAVELLQVCTPLSQTGVIDNRVIRMLLREIFNASEYDGDKWIPDEDEKNKLQATLGSGINGPTSQMANSQADPSALDRRSQPAIDAIATQQGPSGPP
jgi:hypothetical protein